MSEYEKEVEEMKHMTRQEYVASLRRYIMELMNLLHMTSIIQLYYMIETNHVYVF